jgi:beta-lactamase superfamily II metal-dependent hydrolase
MRRSLIWLALVGIVVYIGYQYAAPQVRAWRFRDAMTQAGRLAGTQPDEELRASLIDTARELQVPLAPNRLTVRRDRTGRLHVSASWRELVRIRAWKLGEWVDTLNYAYAVEGTLRGRPR